MICSSKFSPTRQFLTYREGSIFSVCLHWNPLYKIILNMVAVFYIFLFFVWHYMLGQLLDLLTQLVPIFLDFALYFFSNFLITFLFSLIHFLVGFPLFIKYRGYFSVTMFGIIFKYNTILFKLISQTLWYLWARILKNLITSWKYLSMWFDYFLQNFWIIIMKGSP